MRQHCMPDCSWALALLVSSAHAERNCGSYSSAWKLMRPYGLSSMTKRTPVYPGLGRQSRERRLDRCGWLHGDWMSAVGTLIVTTCAYGS